MSWMCNAASSQTCFVWNRKLSSCSSTLAHLTERREINMVGLQYQVRIRFVGIMGLHEIANLLRSKLLMVFAL